MKNISSDISKEFPGKLSDNIRHLMILDRYNDVNMIPTVTVADGDTVLNMLRTICVHDKDAVLKPSLLPGSQTA